MPSHGHTPKKEITLEAKSIELLKDRGLSVTTPRKMILTLLLKEHGPFSAEDIFNKLPKKSCDQVSTAYLEKDMAHFEFNDPKHHHHHIICKICKKIDSFHDCILDKIELTLGKKGYKDIQHRLEFFGVCGSCQKT
jgi:Fur family ferric uptake transcriptional regulator